MEPSPPDIFHVARDEDYLRQLQAEQEFWDNRRDTPLSRPSPPAVQAYLNERTTGRADRRWFETIGDYGSFRRGCVLGAGPGHVESHLLSQHEQLHLTVCDISPGALERLQARLDREFAGRVETRQEDLNFATLPAEAYDLLVADSTIHHIVNLEHLAFQANRSLMLGGFFFMRDVVGESRFQFSEEKKQIFQAYAAATGQSRGRAMTVKWPDPENWTYSPFESARSGEILEVFGRYFREVSVRTAFALLQMTFCARPVAVPAQGGRLPSRGSLLRIAAALRDRLRPPRLDLARGIAAGNLLFALDRIVCDTGYMKPGIAFAIYGKRDGCESEG
jgi:SAM-dependent methyltransferase